jgi:hypothetical protein
MTLGLGLWLSLFFTPTAIRVEIQRELGNLAGALVHFERHPETGKHKNKFVP